MECPVVQTLEFEVGVSAHEEPVCPRQSIGTHKCKIIFLPSIFSSSM